MSTEFVGRKKELAALEQAWKTEESAFIPVLHYYLSTLVELGYVQRRFPLTGVPPTARQVRYSLEDPLLRFWFRFVYPNLSLIARLGANRAVRELVLPELNG